MRLRSPQRRACAVFLALVPVCLVLAGIVRAEPAPQPSSNAADTPEAARAMREILQCPRYVAGGESALQSAIQLADAGDAAGAALQIERSIAFDPDNPRTYVVRAVREREAIGRTWDAIEAASRAAVTGFPNQIVLSLNVFLILLWSVCLGVIGTAGAIVFRYVRHVHHSLRETFAGKAGGAAPLVAALVLLAPLLWGLGLVPTLVFFLLWFSHILRSSERKLVYALVGVGAVLWVTHFVSPGPLGPPGETHEPFRVAAAFETGGTPGFTDELTFVHPSGYSDWARGMCAKRQGRLEEAEASLLTAVKEMPKNTALLVDLGNVQFLRGKLRDAKANYQKALKHDEHCAEAHYNLSQILTEELDLLGADASVQTALALDPGRITDFGEGPAKSMRRAVIDMLPGPAPFWFATVVGSGVRGSIPLPAGLKLLSPGGRVSLMPFGLIAVTVLGILAGQWLRRSVKTHACRSCGTIVCRRCLIRVDGEPYCLDCGNTLSADCSTEYSKALLERYFRKRYTPRSVLARVVRWLLPGWAEVSTWAAGRSIVILSLTGCALLAISLPGPPVTGDTSGSTTPVPAIVVWALAGFLYGTAQLITWRWRDDGDRDYGGDADEPASYRAAAG